MLRHYYDNVIEILVVCVACSDHGVLCIQLDKERVYPDSFVIDTTAHHHQSPGILPLVSLNQPKLQSSVCKLHASCHSLPI